MDVLNSEIQAHKHVENVQASAASKLKSLGLSRFADDFLLFQLPYGTASENLDINMTLYSVILKRELDVMETSGDITRFSRETYVGKSGSTNLIRTREMPYGQHLNMEVKLVKFLKLKLTLVNKEGYPGWNFYGVMCKQRV